MGAIGQQLTAQLEEAAILGVLARHLGALLDATHVAIWLLDETGAKLNLSIGMQDGAAIAFNSIAVNDPDSLAARCYSARQEILVATPLGDEHATLPGTRPMRSVYFGPLIVQDRALGALSVQSPAASAYGERETLILRSLCAYAAIALDNTRAYQQLKQARALLEEASLTDPLTGLRNRRYLVAHIEADVALSLRRHASPARDARESEQADVIFLMIDLDHFKRVNDEHGHAAGDAILVQLSERLTRMLRASDDLVRWGGEEFLIVARAISRARAEELAERICKTVRSEPCTLPDGNTLAKTCSVGFACFPFDLARPAAHTWQQVIDVADVALYAAKHRGRDGWAGIQTNEGEGAAVVDRIKADMSGAAAKGLIRVTVSRPFEPVAASPAM